MTYLKVENHSGLYRDTNTNSIVNKDKTQYHEYMSGKDKRMKESEKVNTIEDDLSRMKNEIQEIKSLLKELVNG
tara:strand:+ start:2049 stop:2270 length:222 start_codon:yes stop_codon:yes gene_type:complete